MEIDVIYRVSNDLCHQHIKRFVKEESVNLALYHSCSDNYTTKKTIWNATGRLTPGGIFCIQVQPENISDVIRLATEQGYKYKIVYCDYSWAILDGVVIYLLMYKSEIVKPKIDTLLRINSIEDMGQKFIGLCNFGDLVLCIGNGTLPFVEMAKRLGRMVIAFGDDPLCVIQGTNQGVREVIL